MMCVGLSTPLQLDVLMAGLKARLGDSDLRMPGAGVAVLTCGPALLQVSFWGTMAYTILGSPLLFSCSPCFLPFSIMSAEGKRIHEVYHTGRYL